MKSKGNTALIVLICILVIISISTVTFISPADHHRVKNNIYMDQLKLEAYAIDLALNRWYKSQGKEYPDNLTKLYDVNYIPKSIDINNFIYSVNMDDTYNLLIKTPSNGTIKSAGSKQ
ncbi:hypothetical protein [Sporomusa sphaeroides]|uniref:Type II secretion system protein G n=1 Tax=Sporomusa sphaeroides DSM 2875 TaxID=1337886 RepID=A0A1U7MAA9_9FIRM|nr:hypothetical protein [Sporomusa sphaeroides]OLS54365.1 hypothetical protein SPSPH_46110 [Sporomusa sphaeroides DSM 2875]CVK21661.1 hypothetical protein SSPH_04356 [Sporomusa sphaeroides DSM 2875]